MRLLIFGASGKTGRELVRLARERQHSVTAFVRRPDAFKDMQAPDRVIQGNVADAAAVRDAVRGHDAVVSTLGVGTPLEHDPQVITGVQHILTAMQEHRVRRLIYMSFVGVQASRSAVGFVIRYIAPIPLRHEIADHEAKEALVMNSAVDWTIVRPPTLTGGGVTGAYRSGEDITSWKPVSLLSRADVADFILNELAEPRFIRKAPRLLH